MRGRTRGGHGSGDFTGNMAGFADTGDDHPPFHTDKDIHSAAEGRAKRITKQADSLPRRRDDSPGNRKVPGLFRRAAGRHRTHQTPKKEGRKLAPALTGWHPSEPESRERATEKQPP
ncbi:hypothetical protein GCM10008941_20450 [Rhizomicrobium palustre]